MNVAAQNRIHILQRTLRDLQSGAADIEAAALISDDGLMIASAMPGHLAEERVAGMAATLLSLGAKAAGELERGEPREVVVRGEEGYVVMGAVGRGVMLMTLTGEQARLGLVQLEMNDALEAIRQVL